MRKSLNRFLDRIATNPFPYATRIIVLVSVFLILFLVYVSAVPAQTPRPTQEVAIEVVLAPDGSAMIFLPKVAVELCMESGGCRIVTGQQLEAFAAEIRKNCKAI